MSVQPGDVVKYRCWVSNEIREAEVLSELESDIYEVQILDEGTRYIDGCQIIEVK